MKQVLLSSGTLCFVAWIPAKFAVRGKVLDLQQPDGRWSESWRVAEVYDHRETYEYVREHERDYKSQREASDV